MPLLNLSDLHRHLDGSLRLSTVRELAAKLGLPIPGQLYFERGMSLEGCLARFEFTLALLQRPEAVKRVAQEICADAQSEGVKTLEAAELDAIIDVGRRAAFSKEG